MAKFTVQGWTFDLDREQVEAAMKRHDPERIRQHAVEVNGKLFPVKQVFQEACYSEYEGRWDRLDFTTNDARRVLKKLGFRLVRVGDT
jgi:PAB1-binding protein PBP1